SIGGTGGDGASVDGAVAIGGSGGVGGVGGTVSVGNNGTAGTRDAEVTPRGDNANAILAQSIGRGGRHRTNTRRPVALGGSGPGTPTGGTVSVRTAAKLLTHGSNPSGILAQSIGGGGGNGGSASGLFAAGGSGAAGGNADTVTVTNGGSIETGRSNGN